MSTIAVAQNVMGWLPMWRRPSCSNFGHGEERQEPRGATRWHCLHGGFNTQALAICDRHEPRRETVEWNP